MNVTKCPVPTETDEQRRIREAEDRGRRKQQVDGRLDALEEHARNVNGQIGRLADGQDAINKKVDGLTETVKTADAVGKALATQAKEAIDKQVTSRQFWVGVALVMVSLLSVYVATGGHP